jgi:hypothetical protein
MGAGAGYAVGSGATHHSAQQGSSYSLGHRGPASESNTSSSNPGARYGAAHQAGSDGGVTSGTSDTYAGDAVSTSLVSFFLTY